MIMKIYVIENSPKHHEKMVLILRALYPDASVTPNYDEPFSRWEKALELVKSTPEEGEIVFVVDLALEGRADDVTYALDGIEQSRRIRRLRPAAILIAATSYAGAFDHDPQARIIFDEILDKQSPEWKSDAGARSLMRKSIDNALSLRNGIQGNKSDKTVDLQDSLGMRLLEAAIGSETIEPLVLKTTVGWSERRAVTLSSGFSGSQLLQVTGNRGGQPAKLVLKVATKKEILEDEVQRPKIYADRLHAFAGHLNTSLGEVMQLDQHQIFYIIQSAVEGDTLYEVMKNGPKRMADKLVNDLLKLLINQCQNAVDAGESSNMLMLDCFRLSSMQLHWVHNSCDSLTKAGKTLKKTGGWPDGLPSPATIFCRVGKVADNWNSYLATVQAPCWPVQHGDLHPGNVLARGTQLSFIDLARLGSWPIGYDISRFSVQTRMRLLDQKNESDWVINNLSNWVKEEFANLCDLQDSTQCPLANKCDKTFAEFVDTRPEDERVALRRVYELSALSDLLRILSYKDLSIFKRLWAGIACWQLGQRLGF